jgi:hypothetical protein
MKQRTTRTIDPLDRAVDFTRFGPVRRNAFAGAGEPGGPSLLALWEMPQLATDAVLMRRGRPVKGSSRRSTVRSVRLPEALWEELARTARSKRLNLHQAMRAALLGWLHRAR